MPLGRIIAVMIGVGALLWVLNAMGVVNISSETSKGLQNMPKAQDMDPWARAEASFIALQYRPALAAYHDALQAKPDHPKAAEAYYRIAKCLEELRESNEALAAYRTYVQKFPEDEAVRLQAAHKRIALLSGGG